MVVRTIALGGVFHSRNFVSWEGLAALIVVITFSALVYRRSRRGS